MWHVSSIKTKVALRPGVFGKSLATGLKSLNEKLRPMYDQYRITCGLSNRFCVAAASLYRGGRGEEEDYYLTDSDFGAKATHDFDKYVAPSGWTIAPRARASHHVETWKINATNMSRMFAAVYGGELLQERLDAIEHLRFLRVEYPHKYTLRFAKSAWRPLNYRWVQEMREMTNILRIHAQVEQPTFAQQRSIGVTVVTSTGETVYRLPKTPNLSDPAGYFVTEVVRMMHEEKELNEWNSYHSGAPLPGNQRVGALPPPLGLPGPPMTPVERRLDGKDAPKTPSGGRIFWNYNSHIGCSDASRPRARNFYQNYGQLSYALKIALAQRYGFKKRGKLSVEQIGEEIKTLRQAAKQEAERNRTQPAVRGDQHPNSDPARRVGKTNNAPPCLEGLDYTDQEGELRKTIRSPIPEFGLLAQKQEFDTAVNTAETCPDEGDPLLSQSRDLMGKLANDPELKFPRDRSPHLSSYVSSYVTHELRKGVSDTQESVRQALLLASEQGVSTLREEASTLLASHRRVGHSGEVPTTVGRVVFSSPIVAGGTAVTSMSLRGRTWEVFDFGDTIPHLSGDPVNDVYGKTGPGENKCMPIHLAAAALCSGGPAAKPTARSDLMIPDVLKRAGHLRWGQCSQALTCRGSLGEPTSNDPLAVDELRSHIRDVTRMGHDCDRRTLMCSPLRIMSTANVRILRVSLACRYTVHLIHAVQSSANWIYLISYQEHMRAIQRNDPEAGLVLRKAPETATNPPGWESLLAFCSPNVSIYSRNLSRRPHCQETNARLPLGRRAPWWEGQC